MTKNYTSDLQEALRQLLLMSSEKEQLETRIAKQKKRVAALYELVQTDEGSAALSGLVEGITDACRVVFRAAEKPLDPAEVRDRVQALGLPPQANLLASVHTTLRRMKEAGEIDEVTTESTRGLGPQPVGYVWVGVQRYPNVFADLIAGRPTRESATAALENLDTARKRFAHAHKAKLEREEAKRIAAVVEAERKTKK